MIRTTKVRFQDVDKPAEVAKLFNEVFDALRLLSSPKPEPKPEPKPKVRQKGKKQ